jgi:hypothetical protein
MKCNEGDLTYTRKDRSVGTQDQDQEAWERLYDQYIAKYGLGKLHQRMLKAMQEKAILECEYVQTKDRFKLNLIEIEAQRLKDMMSNGGEGMSMDESLVYLGKWVGYRLDIRTTTVVEYFNMLKHYGKENKQK